MYSTEKYYPSSEEELLELLSDSMRGGNKVAIVGGHYMLFYDKIANELKPAIWQELNSENQIRFAKQNAGNFPIRSFQYSAELFKRFKLRGINSGVLLLVNDHKFQSPNFQPDIATEVSGKGGELRRAYFKKNLIPKCYIDTLGHEGLSPNEVFITNNNPNRLSDDLLPCESWFYSEQKLRKRFDKYVVPQLLKQEKVYSVSSGNAKDIYYQLPILGTEICLTENGSCGCSAEVTELIIDMLKKQINEIILFIPNECISAVDNGITVALNINEMAAKVITVSGIGGMGISDDSLKQFSVVEHSFG